MIQKLLTERPISGHGNTFQTTAGLEEKDHGRGPSGNSRSSIGPFRCGKETRSSVNDSRIKNPILKD
jgi:hypothetical protein